MTKLMIVDDEEKTRKSIRNIIDWESNGIQVTGEAENGAEALVLLNAAVPDIIITDIRMPEMDGLQLIESLSKKNVKAKIIIMSGYDDFTYAQKAMKHGVSEYLLKPSRAGEILEAVLKVKALIESENAKKEMYDRLKVQFQESLPLLRDKYLNRLIRSKNRSIKNLNEKLFLFNTVLSFSYAAVAVIRIDNLLSVREELGNEDFELMKFAVRNISEETISAGYPCEIFENNDDVIIILKLEEYPDFPDIHKLFTELKNNVFKFLRLSVSIAHGRFYDNADSLYMSFNEAVKTLEIKSFHGNGQILAYEDLLEEDAVEMSYPITCEKELLDCIKNSSVHEFDFYIEEFFIALKVESTSKGNVLKSVLALLFSIYHLCIEMNINTDETFGNNFSILEDLLKMNNVSLMKDKLLTLSRAIAQNIVSRKCNNKILEHAIKYILENYNKDLSREIVAREVYIAPGYLSMLFKNEMGTSFLEFLHKARIEKACELLKGSLMKTYEIASITGYKDEKYFFQVFKKYIGMTPLQYRDSF